jgi:regulatory protein
MSPTDHGGGERSDDALAPVIPLFGPRPDEPIAPERTSGPAWDTTWAQNAGVEDTSGGEVDAGQEAAEAALLRKLRTRQLSVVEARRILRDHELDEGAAAAVIARLEHLGYLDDRRLADQLAQAALTRKGQGRRAIALALTTRGIERDVAEAALQEFPDDEAERALDVARSRARRVGIDREAALRRLVGQLTRRGFGSSVAMTAARAALDELG